MRNLSDRMDDIKEMVAKTIKNCKRTFEIIQEMLEKNEFNKTTYGEAKLIEDKINLFENKAEEEVIKTIARFQPLAINLRFLISVIKFSITFERINDLSINILKVMKRSNNLKEYEQFKLLEMLKIVQNMFELFSKSYFDEDLNFSYLILSLDEEVNTLRNSIIEELRAGSDSINKVQLEGLFISQHLERIGDSIKNLAEMVIYIYNGVDIRHGSHESE